MAQRSLTVFRNRFGELRCLWAILAYLLAATLLGNATTWLSVLPAGWAPYTNRIITIALAVGMWKLIYRKPMRDFGLVTKSSGRAIGIGLLAGALAISAVVGVLYLTGSVRLVRLNLAVFSDGTIWYGLALWLLVGIAEEAQFRGFAMGALKSTRSRLIVIGGSSLWFSLVHLSNVGYNLAVAIGVALGGVFFAYLFFKSGTLLLGIAFHFAWDFFEAEVFGLGHPGLTVVQPRAADLLVGSAGFGVEGGLVSIGFFLVAIAVVHFFVRNETGDGFTMPSRTWRRSTADATSESATLP